MNFNRNMIKFNIKIKVKNNKLIIKINKQSNFNRNLILIYNRLKKMIKLIIS